VRPPERDWTIVRCKIAFAFGSLGELTFAVRAVQYRRPLSVAARSLTAGQKSFSIRRLRPFTAQPQTVRKLQARGAQWARTESGFAATDASPDALCNSLQ